MHIATSSLASLDLGFGGYTCNWGTHFCGLYETKAERDELMYGFLAKGFLQNELLVCCQEEVQHDVVIDKVHSLCPDVGSPVSSLFKLFNPSNLYYPRGAFSPRDMIAAHESIWAENIATCARNVRGTAEMSWSLEKIPGVDNLMAYESLLNTFIWGKAWISICLYDVSRFPGSTIMKVFQTHPFVITSGGVFENPYFIHPDKWLAEHAPEFLRVA